jgi:type III secretion system YscQ/HrcQ family protein
MKLSPPVASGFPFGNLPAYTPDEVNLWNWFCRSFSNPDDWRNWLSDIFSRVLARRVGQELVIIQSHRSQSGVTEFRFNTHEIRLGRGTENDLTLSGASISKNHARLFLREDAYFVEDQGSLLGTYLNANKLVPGEASIIRSGDQLVIFPYTFTVKTVPVWSPESDVQLHTGPMTTSTWDDFLRNAPLAYSNFFLTAYPTNHSAGLQIERGFVRAIIDRALTPLGVPSVPGGASDTGVLTLLLLGILEHANKRLAYPFQFALTPTRLDPQKDQNGRGLSVVVTVRLSGTSGIFRIFLPYRLLAAMSELSAAKAELQVPEAITWKYRVSAGTLTLTVEEARQLEPGDVVIFDRRPQLLFSNDFKKGWNISFEESNFSIATIDKHFKDEVIVEDQVREQDSRKEGLDLGSLPISLHVIVGEKELTLSEANGLAPGTILHLQRDVNNVVQLAINGKIVGQGQLVDIEGKLGVRIGKWEA